MESFAKTGIDMKKELISGLKEFMENTENNCLI